MNRAERRRQAKLNKKPNVRIGFVDQIMHNLDLHEEPQLAYTMMVEKLLDTPSRKQTLCDTGEVYVNYTIQANGLVVETPMQEGVDKGVENLIVMDEPEATQFGKRHGVLIVKDSAKQSKEWVSKLAPELQDALTVNGDLYIGKMYFGDTIQTTSEYIGGAFRREMA